MPDKNNAKMNSSEKNANLCEGCSLCCGYITIPIRPPNDRRSIEEIRWWLLHGVYIFVGDNGKWMIEVPNRCQKLGTDGRCKEYSNRPDVCINHTQIDCEKYGPDTPYPGGFWNSDESFMEYVNKTPKLRAAYGKK